jgi:hypothetical protein
MWLGKRLQEACMTLTDELDDVVTELSRCHPRFRRVTIERLVARTADRHAGLPPEALQSAVLREAGAQLRYVDDTPDPASGCAGRPVRQPARRRRS